jgi:hypothetical protein
MEIAIYDTRSGRISFRFFEDLHLFPRFLELQIPLCIENVGLYQQNLESIDWGYDHLPMSTWLSSRTSKSTFLGRMFCYYTYLARADD